MTMSNLYKGPLYMIPHKRTCGSKFHMRQQMIKDGLISPDSVEPEVRYMRLLTPTDRSHDLTGRPIIDLSKDERPFKEIIKDNLYTANKFSLPSTNRTIYSLTQQTSNNKNDNQFPELKTNNDKSKQCMPEPKANNNESRQRVSESKPNNSETGQHMHKSITNNSCNDKQMPEPKINMGPPTNASKKRKRKKRNQKQRIIQSKCYEPEIFPGDITNRNYGDDNLQEENMEDYYPACPSPASTGSLTQSIFQNNAYKRNCTNINIAERNLLPFSLSSNSDTTVAAQVNQVNAFANLLDISSSSSNNNTALRQGTTITLTDTSINTVLKVDTNKTITLSDISNSTICKQGKIATNLSDNEEHLSSKEQSKNISCSQSFLQKNTVINSLKRPDSQLSRVDTIDMLSNNSTSTEEDSGDSTSLLENYCTANDFTILESEPKNIKQPISTDNSNFFNFISNNETNRENSISKPEILAVNEIILEKDDLHNRNAYPKEQETASFDRCADSSNKQLSNCNFNATTGNKVARLSPSMKQKSWPLSNTNTKYKNFKDFDSSEEVSFCPTKLSRNNSAPVSSQSSTSSNEEYLSEESKICLGKIVKVLASHYDLPVSKCVSVLKLNSFNLLTSLQELQLAAISSSAISEISNALF